jgi:hypothetical protein
MLCCILGWVGTNVLDEPAACRQQANLKMVRAGFFETLIPAYQIYSITSQKTAVRTVTAVRTLDLVFFK